MTAAALRDRLCICGRRGSSHAEPGSGDPLSGRRGTEDLVYVPDDGRETEHAYCACLRFIDAKEPR
jgi:hypothetical protein